MRVLDYRGYRIRSKNDGAQYYEVRYHGEKKFSGKTLLEAVRFINNEHELKDILRTNQKQDGLYRDVKPQGLT